jgi:molybdopterin-guanine dinucleotide biosynthesis protein A
MTPYDLVVLAGGRARRLGGIDKVALPLAGRSSLTRLLDAATTAQRVVVVGPSRETPRPVTWCRESPPGGGPLAAVAAALPLTSARAVVVVAGDMPRVGEALDRLVGELDGHPLADVTVLCDRQGVRQPLAAVYRRDSLRDRLRVIGDPADRAARLLLDDMTVVEVAAPSATVDCDTWDDIAAVTEELRALDSTTARARAAEGTPPPRSGQLHPEG